MRSSFAVAVAACASCDSSITLEIAGDRPVPRSLDAICVGVADTDEDGGHLGQLYPLTGELASLPQTLRIDPGRAGGAYLWVRGDRGGAPVTYVTARTSFDGDVRLALERCPVGRGGAPQPMGDPVGPAGARLVRSHGSGNLVVALGAEATIVDASGERLAVVAGPPLPAGAVTSAIAADIDGDCDDDLIVATDGDAPIVWRREHRHFTVGEPLDSGPVAALAAADINRDGAMDLVTGVGASLALWYNDGTGRFALDPDDLKANGRVSSVRALVLGDVDANGSADLIVGQGGAPLRAWLGGMNGAFEENDGVIAAAPLDVVQMTLADADGDPNLDPDLAVAVRGKPAKLYLDREGQLEDRTFERMPRDPAPPNANAIALGNWDDSRCYPEMILAADGESAVLRGDKDAFSIERALAAATDVVMIDLDEDGDLDAVLATPEGVRWLAR